MKSNEKVKFMEFQVETTGHFITKETTQIISDKLSIYEFEFTNTGNHQNQAEHIGELSFTVPMIDQYSYWSVDAHMDNVSGLDVIKVKSSLSRGAPVLMIHNGCDCNAITVAHNDTLNDCMLTSSVIEETACNQICIKLPAVMLDKGDTYKISVYIDMRKESITKVLDDIRMWWEKHEGCRPARTPAPAKQAMYSTWYSFHQNFTQSGIINQLASAKKMGCETVIIDDGWQTDDNRRGYASCGDWEVCKSKIADMKKFVDEVHEMGMKIILWYSVPFVGYHSRIYNAFKGKYLYHNDKMKASILDPRFKEVRDFLIKLYQDAVIHWNLDGLKLDFIDSFGTRDPIEYGNGRDDDNLENAVDVLMKAIYKALTDMNPDFMLEFRQSYIGPRIRTYGNILRACDCPNSGLSNRGRVTDIRLLAGNTAVHSDMLTWNKDELPSEVAKQLIDVLFSVPQISIKYDELSHEHHNVLRFYQSFWNQYKDVLIGSEAEFGVEGFGYHYSLIKTVTPQTGIYALYAGHAVVINRYSDKIIIINATGHGSIIVENAISAKTIEIYNCQGEVITKNQYHGQNVERIQIPSGGMAEISS